MAPTVSTTLANSTIVSEGSSISDVVIFNTGTAMKILKQTLFEKTNFGDITFTMSGSNWLVWLSRSVLNGTYNELKAY